MRSEKQTIIDLLDSTNGAPLLYGQFMAEGGEILRLVALKYQGISHAVSQRIATRHLWLAVLLNLELCVVKPEVRRIAL